MVPYSAFRLQHICFLASCARNLSTKPAAGYGLFSEKHLEGLMLCRHANGACGHLQLLGPKFWGDTGHKVLSAKVSADRKNASWNHTVRRCLYEDNMKAISSQVILDAAPTQDAAQSGPVYDTLSVQEICTDRDPISLKRTLKNLREPCEILSYFESRKISRKTLARNQVKEMHHKVHGVVVVFPYFMCGETVNFKFRTLRKMFWQLKHSLKVFYGLDDIISASEIIIVEGEIDKLAMEEAGFLNCVSVPDGAPGKISAEYSPCEIEDRMFSYIWNCKEYFKKASRIIIATDGDHPGQILAEELGHRLGRERCYRVQWPKQPDGTKVYKDANEVLVELGAEALRSVVQTAKLYPVHGLLTFNYFLNELDLCIRQHIGVSTGWACLDDFYKVVPGELTLVTGAPDSGKGEWIDALAVNLVESEGWAFAMCFVGNKVQEHARKLLEKHRKKPFFNALYADCKEIISQQELETGKQWLNDNFFVISCDDKGLPSVDRLLSLAQSAVMKHGIRGLVVDPHNELDHCDYSQPTEIEYMTKMLTRLRSFAQHNACHVWFITHPRQLQVWLGGPPHVSDVSGSVHFITKCDNCIVIHCSRDPCRDALDKVEIVMKKTPNKASRLHGSAVLYFNRFTGLYSDVAREKPR